MFTQLKILFRQLTNDTIVEDVADTPTRHLAMASLLCEVSRADNVTDHQEEAAKIHLLTALLDISEPEAMNLLDEAYNQVDNAVSLYDFTSKLRSLEAEQRYVLIEAMWQVAYADGVLDPMEESVIRQVAELIYVDHSEFIRAKITAEQASPTHNTD